MQSVTPASEYVNSEEGRRGGGNCSRALDLSLGGDATGSRQVETLGETTALPPLPLFTGQPFDPSAALGFNNRRISPTDDFSLPPVDPFVVQYRELEHWQKRYVQMQNEADGYAVGISLSLYPSGEFTAACTALGPKPQKSRKPKGGISSTDLTPTARKIMKRAIENHWRPFNRHYVFTFDPKLEKNVLSPDGTIDHSFARAEISRTLEAVSLKYQRMADRVKEKTGGKTGRHWEFSYICVAETQPGTNNIHYHVLADRHVDIQYLVKLWGQSSNSVHVEKVAGIRALKYLFSYIKKGQSLVYGKRYSLSQSLYGELKPSSVKITGRHARSIFLDFIKSRGATILSGRGYLGDWGFSLPPPSRQAVPSSCQRQFILELAELLDQGGYPELLQSITGTGGGETVENSLDTPF